MKKYIIAILITFVLTSSVSILLTFYYYNNDINKMDIEKQKLEKCYQLAETKKKIKYKSACIIGSGYVNDDGCIGYLNGDDIIEEYKKDLTKCLKNK